MNRAECQINCANRTICRAECDACSDNYREKLEDLDRKLGDTQLNGYNCPYNEPDSSYPGYENNGSFEETDPEFLSRSCDSCENTDDCPKSDLNAYEREQYFNDK